jgi:hypothetical protein
MRKEPILEHEDLCTSIFFTLNSYSMLILIRSSLCVLLLLAVVFTAQIQAVIDFTWHVLRHNTLYNLSFFETLHVPIYGALVLYIFYEGYKKPSWRHYLLNPASKMRKLSRFEKIRETLYYIIPLLMLDLTKQKRYHNSVVSSMQYDIRYLLLDKSTADYFLGSR